MQSSHSIWTDSSSKTKKRKSPFQRRNIDSGYAWIIVFAAFCGHVFIYGIAWTQGVFYMIFLEEFQESPSKTAWIGTISTTCNFLGGPVGSIVSNRFGSRAAIALGTLISTIGLSLNYTANSIMYLMVTFATAGFGLGITYVPIVASVGEYFDRFRNMAIGFAVAGVGFGTFIYPPLIRFLIEHFDWQGALLVMGALNLNLLVVGALLRPVDSPLNMPAVEQVADDIPLHSMGSIVLDMTHEDEEPFEHEGLTGEERRGEWVEALNTSSKGWMDVLQIDVLVNGDYICLVVNTLLTMFGYSIVYMHIGNYAMSLNFSVERCTLILSAIGVANLVGRILFGFVGQHPNMNVIGLYAVTGMASGFITSLCPLLRYYPGLLILSGLFGFLTAAMGVLLPEVLVLTVGLRRLRGGYGYNLIGQAFGFLLGGPVAGFLIETYGTYSGTFYLAGGCILTSGLCMLLPWHRSLQPWDLSKLAVDKDFHGFGVPVSIASRVREEHAQ